MGTQKVTELLTPNEVEERFGISKKWLANLRHLRKGPAYIKLGGKKILYDPNDVVEWIQLNSRKIQCKKFL